MPQTKAKVVWIPHQVQNDNYRLLHGLHALDTMNGAFQDLLNPAFKRELGQGAAMAGALEAQLHQAISWIK